VETPGVGAETVSFTPSGVDAGSLTILEGNPLNGTLISLVAVEELVYDGEADQDSVRVIGTAGADTTVHRPGLTDDSGQLRVNSWLALDYQSLGLGAEVVSDGAGGNNTLVYQGTAGADLYRIDRTLSGGVVNLNGRVELRTLNTQGLIVESLGGDDVVTLVPAIQDSPYGTITVNGGEEASSSGDILNLVGSANADGITISGRRVSAGGVSVDG